MIVREMSGPFGIPDFTAFIGARSTVADRLALAVPPLTNEIDAAIVGMAHVRSPRSHIALSRALGWPEDTIARRIRGLVRSGALQLHESGGYTRPSALRPLGRVYAVETKVNDRAGALRQAKRYKLWADAYVLVMGELSERASADLLASVTKDRGGLMVGGRWLRRPALGSLTAPRRLWASEHLVAALTDYQPSSAP